MQKRDKDMIQTPTNFRKIVNVYIWVHANICSYIKEKKVSLLEHDFLRNQHCEWEMVIANVDRTTIKALLRKEERTNTVLQTRIRIDQE